MDQRRNKQKIGLTSFSGDHVTMVGMFSGRSGYEVSSEKQARALAKKLRQNKMQFGKEEWPNQELALSFDVLPHRLLLLP